jgi:hypothetical protein
MSGKKSQLKNFSYHCSPKWKLSSVGLEHRLDRAGVISSNLIVSTQKMKFHLIFMNSISLLNLTTEFFGKLNLVKFPNLSMMV